MLVTLSAGECWMRPPANPAAMHITACSKSAVTLIVAPAEFIGAARRPNAQHSRWSLPWGIPREPGCRRLVWVLRTTLGWVVILQAVCAPGDKTWPASECLTVQSWVSRRPVEVFLVRASHLIWRSYATHRPA